MGSFPETLIDPKRATMRGSKKRAANGMLTLPTVHCNIPVCSPLNNTTGSEAVGKNLVPLICVIC